MNSDKNNRRITLTTKGFSIVIISLLIVGALIGTTIFYLYLYTAKQVSIVNKQQYTEMKYLAKKYEKTEFLYTTLKEKYYKDIEDEVLMEGIYKGLYAATGDQYTSYMSDAEYQQLTTSLDESFYGIGVSMSVEDDQIVVVGVIKDSSAEAAGIKAGDIIYAVDGIKYKGSELEVAAANMRGKAGTKVEITYIRNSKMKTISLMRKKVANQSVGSTIIDDDIGYIRISKFTKSTGEEFKVELKRMEQADVVGLIIDLRLNGGGVVESGIEVADALLPKGNIAYIENKEGVRSYFNSDEGETRLPYILLIDNGTASTSELVAAAIKDHKGDVIVGTTSFGKGIIQDVLKLKSGGAIKITTRQYFSPNGNIIHEKGVEPSYIVEINSEDTEDRQLEKAIELLRM